MPRIRNGGEEMQLSACAHLYPIVPSDNHTTPMGESVQIRGFDNSSRSDWFAFEFGNRVGGEAIPGICDLREPFPKHIRQRSAVEVAPFRGE